MAQNDEKSTVANVLSVLFPIVGYVAYFMWRDDTPVRAKSVLISALIGSVIGLIFFSI